MQLTQTGPCTGRAPRVLLTGFEPFGGETVNPSQWVVAALAGARVSGCTLHTAVIPVDRGRAAESLLRHLELSEADVIIALGEAGGRARVSPERVAINVDDYGSPDNAGHQPMDEAVVPGGPAAYFATLPLRAMVKRLEADGIPAEISNSAGTYLCNHVFYRLMHRIAHAEAGITAGFVHLPYLHEQVRGKPGAPPSMSPETLVEAVRVVLDVAIAGRKSADVAGAGTGD